MGKPKRNLLATAEQTLVPPDSLEPNQSLARVVKSEGCNLFTCELPNQKTLLLELAQRFRNTIWIRRGGYVLTELYVAEPNDGRAVGEIVNVVRDEKSWRKQPYWPKEFTKNTFGIDDEYDDQDSTVGKMPPTDSEED